MRVWSLGREDPLEDGMAIHSRLENPMNKGAWQATVPGGAKSQTRLKWLSMHVGMHLPLKNVSVGKLWSSPLAVTVGNGWALGTLAQGPPWAVSIPPTSASSQPRECRGQKCELLPLSWPPLFSLCHRAASCLPHQLSQKHQPPAPTSLLSLRKGSEVCCWRRNASLKISGFQGAVSGQTQLFGSYPSYFFVFRLDEKTALK